MSILIKGMEMPTNCFDCPCVNAEFMKCAAKEHLSLPKDKYGAVLGDVPNWCPLAKVPPHGALMDRDDFFATCPELVDGYKCITDDLVVIPAEEGET